MDFQLLLYVLFFMLGFLVSYKIFYRIPYIYVDRKKNQVKIQFLKKIPISSHPELTEEDKTLISNLSSDDYEFYESLIDHKNQIIAKKFSEFVKDIRKMGGI